MEMIGVIFLAVFLEGLMTYLFKKDGEDTSPKPWIKYIALLFGVLLAIAYKIDMPSAIGLSTSIVLVNYIISGIVIGRGSNYVNDIMSFFTKKKE